MATKPVAVPAIWASNVNWTVGPRTGSPTKVTPSAGVSQNGQVGGRTFKGQWSNYLHNVETTWIATWLALGSSAGAEDAHIVETDASGFAAVARVTIPGGAATAYGLRATGTVGAGPANGVEGIGVGAAAGVTGAGGAGASAGTGDARAGGFGVRGISGNHASLAGVLGIGLNGSDAGGVAGYGDGDGDGVYGEAETADGAGVLGVSPGIGVSGQGFSGVFGVSDDTAGAGVYGQTAAGATTSGRAIRGQAFGDGVALYGVAADGYALSVQSDTSSPTRAAVHIEPQDANPGTAQSGDLFFSDELVGGTARDDLFVRRRGAWRAAMFETRGYCRGFGYSAGPTTATTAGVEVTALSGVALAAPNEPREAGLVWIEITLEVGRAGNTGAQNAIVRIVDATDVVTVVERTVQLFEAHHASLYERTYTLRVSYTLPAAGARSFDVEIETTTGGGDNVRVRDTSMRIYGVL